MKNTFAGKNVLISGGSSGIGLALARLLAAEGAHVWLLARDEKRLQQALEQVRASSSLQETQHGILPADVCNPQQVEHAVSEMTAAVGAPQVLINAAGQAHPGNFIELEEHIFRQLMEVNYFGTLNTIRAILQPMIQQRSGIILNISSLAAVLGIWGYTAYGSSKFAVRGFTESLRAELKPYGIQVFLACPGDTDTPQLAYENQYKPAETKQLAKFGGLMSAESVAKSILLGMKKGQFLILPGLDAKMTYWLVNLLGGSIHPILDWIYAQAQKNERGG